MTKKERQTLAFMPEEQAPTMDPSIVTPDEFAEAQNLIDDIESVYPPVGTVEDTAELLKMPVTSVRKLCRTGQLDGFKVGKLWRIPRVALLSFIENGGC